MQAHGSICFATTETKSGQHTQHIITGEREVISKVYLQGLHKYKHPNTGEKTKTSSEVATQLIEQPIHSQT
jgi:hypothetical protein